MARRTLPKLGIIVCGLLVIFFINTQQTNKLSEGKAPKIGRENLRQMRKMLVLRSTKKHQNGIMLLVGGTMPIVIPVTFNTKKVPKKRRRSVTRIIREMTKRFYHYSFGTGFCAKRVY